MSASLTVVDGNEGGTRPRRSRQSERNRRHARHELDARELDRRLTLRAALQARVDLRIARALPERDLLRGATDRRCDHRLRVHAAHRDQRHRVGAPRCEDEQRQQGDGKEPRHSAESNPCRVLHEGGRAESNRLRPGLNGLLSRNIPSSADRRVGAELPLSCPHCPTLYTMRACRLWSSAKTPRNHWIIRRQRRHPPKRAQNRFRVRSSASLSFLAWLAAGWAKSTWRRLGASKAPSAP